jgi:carboxymethylenebutenolidase
MCDETNLSEWDDHSHRAEFTRRRFAVLGGAVTLAACTGLSSGEAAEQGLIETRVSITTQDGTIDAFFVHPVIGKHPAVILWPDIASLREAKMMMARRLAAAGYAVLVTNPYYRDVPAPAFADFAAFRADNGFAKVGPWRGKLTAEAIMRDAAAMVAWLDTQDSVNTARGIGTQGYCMGGPFTVWSAAAVPGRIKAAASFHGGGLVRGDDPVGPSNLFDRTQADYLIAIAQNDDAKAPEEKDVIRAAAAAASRPAVVDVYAADHGWTVPDSPVYDKPEAERAWSALLELYQQAL